MEEGEAERGLTRIPESVFVSGPRQKSGWKLEQGEGLGWWSHWCCYRSGGWKSGGDAAGDAGGCGRGGWRREAWEQLDAGCCVGSGGGGSWPKWTSTWSESVEVAVEAAEGVARAEAQEEEGQRAAGPNAGPCSPG